jgi:AraC-like DNA-binding protein
MPKTIRKTLLARLQASPRLAELQRDVYALTGVSVHLVGSAYESDAQPGTCGTQPLCERVRAVSMGCEHCRRFRESLIFAAEGEGVQHGRCDAGLTGLCVPIRAWGETLGYLITRGFRVGEFDLAAQNRMRHLLGRLGVDEQAAVLEMRQDVQVLTEAEFAALRRWLQLAAEAWVRSLDYRKESRRRSLPGCVAKLCAVIQQHYENPPSLVEAAAISGMSKGHFCRVFHESTGLRFVEYIQAVRIKHVCDKLRKPTWSITDAAFDSGFESISQFNRVFRKHMGQSPREWRQGLKLAST